jgi:predicted ATPase
MEVARLLEPAFTDGVAFVALAALSDPALVLPAIRQALGLHETAGYTPLEILQARLGDKQLLLLLDNCEQVVAAAPDIANLLLTATGIRVLATSRTRLGVSGERIYPLPPLPVPGPAAASDRAALAQVDAVKLFVARAQDVLPGFALSEENAAAVAAICARVDGLPLAIELAAARIRLLAPAALLKRLDRSLALLSDGPRDAPRRHQTLRETIAWSYDLLDTQGQALFRRLGVFVGGCSVEAVAAVCQIADGPEADMLVRVSALVDQSLLAVVPPAGNHTGLRPGTARNSR